MKYYLLLFIITTSLNGFSQFPQPTLFESNVPVETAIVLGNEILYFGNVSKELWKTDGVNSRVFVKKLDTISFNISSNIVNCLVHHNLLYFTYELISNQGSTSYGVWRTDGTDTGTYVINSTTYSNQFYCGNGFAIVMDTLFFTGSDSIYKVVGNQIKGVVRDFSFPDQTTGNIFSYRNFLFYYDYNQKIYHAWDILTHFDTALVSSLGSVSGSVAYNVHSHIYNDTIYLTDVYSYGEMLMYIAPDLNYHCIDSALNIYSVLGTVNNKMIFSANRPSDSVNTYLYVYDLVQKTISYIDPGTPYFRSLRLNYSDNSICYFSADDSIHGVECWKTDGTFSGTMMIADFSQGIANSWVGEAGNFADPIYTGSQEIYKCGPFLYMRIEQNWPGTPNPPAITNPGGFHVYDGMTISQHVIPHSSDWPDNFVEMNNDVFFQTMDSFNLTNTYKFTCGPNVSAEEFFNIPGCKIYPNPASGNFNILFNELLSENMEINISNIEGTIVSRRHLYTGTGKINIDMSSLPVGIYSVSIFNSKYRQTIKLVKT